MMLLPDADLDLALQRAILAELRANSALMALGSPPLGSGAYAPPKDRIFDRVPQSMNGDLYPYLTIGEDVIADEANDCFQSANCLVTVHVWSRAVGRAEAKAIGGQVRLSLDKLIAIDGHVTVAGGFETAIWRAGPDTLETEGVLAFRYLVDQLVTE